MPITVDSQGSKWKSFLGDNIKTQPAVSQLVKGNTLRQGKKPKKPNYTQRELRG